MKKVENRLKIKFLKKDNAKKFIKQESKLNCNGAHYSYAIYDS